VFVFYDRREPVSRFNEARGFDLEPESKSQTTLVARRRRSTYPNLHKAFEAGRDGQGSLEHMLVDTLCTPLNSLDQVVAEHHVADTEDYRGSTDRLQDMIDEFVQFRLGGALLEQR
jgi:hypothetical protein